MPSKKYNGNTPLGSLRLGSLSDVELEVAKRTPKQAMTTGVVQTHNGSFHTPKRRQRATKATTPCILGYLSIDTENSTEEDTKYKINTGFLSGGGSTEIITPNDLTANIDDFVWLKVLWTADVIDGVLQAGGTMGDVTVATGSTIPDDTNPTVDATSGIAYVTLGGWITDNVEAPNGPNPVWVKQGCGSIQLYFCPGQGFFFGRNNAVEA
jgi:hypothetical protein